MTGTKTIDERSNCSLHAAAVVCHGDVIHHGRLLDDQAYDSSSAFLRDAGHWRWHLVVGLFIRGGQFTALLEGNFLCLEICGNCPRSLQLDRLYHGIYVNSLEADPQNSTLSGNRTAPHPGNTFYQRP